MNNYIDIEDLQDLTTDEAVELYMQGYEVLPYTKYLYLSTEGEPREYGIVNFTSSPSGATIYVDGHILVDPDTEEIKRTSTSALIIEGRRDITYSLPPLNDVSFYVDVYANKRVSVHRNLE